MSKHLDNFNSDDEETFVANIDETTDVSEYKRFLLHPVLWGKGSWIVAYNYNDKKTVSVLPVGNSI
jgi:hypothetical protein